MTSEWKIIIFGIFTQHAVEILENHPDPQFFVYHSIYLQGVQDQNFQIQIAITQKLCT